MQKVTAENDKLKYENTKLRSDLARITKEANQLKVKLDVIRNSRDNLETNVSELVTENEELKEVIAELEDRLKMDTPILSKTVVHFEDVVDEKVPEPKEKVLEKVPEKVPEKPADQKKKKKDVEKECFSESGPNYDSTWYKNISIVNSTENYIVLKNNHPEMHQSLDDYLFFRLIDGQTVVPGVPMPMNTIIPPHETFTIHADHSGAQSIPGKSCILHRFTTFGTGKVTENRLIDEEGETTASYILCVFRE